MLSMSVYDGPDRDKEEDGETVVMGLALATNSENVVGESNEAVVGLALVEKNKLGKIGVVVLLVSE